MSKQSPTDAERLGKQSPKLETKEQRAPFVEPATVAVLKLIGWIAVISGILALIGGIMDSNTTAAVLGGGSLISGVVYLGFSTGLSLLAKIHYNMRTMAETVLRLENRTRDAKEVPPAVTATKPPSDIYKI